MDEASEARGSGYSNTVAEDAWKIFFDGMNRVEQALFEVARALPAEVDPWSQLIWTGISLQIPLEELTARFDAAQARSPWDPMVVGATLQGLCNKWSGSHEMMWAFARMVASSAPAGSPAISALPQAHLEHIISMQRDDHPTPFALLESYETKQELFEALERCVSHPDFEWNGPGIQAANTFVCAIFQAGYSAEVDPILQNVFR